MDSILGFFRSPCISQADNLKRKCILTYISLSGDKNRLRDFIPFMDEKAS